MKKQTKVQQKKRVVVKQYVGRQSCEDALFKVMQIYLQPTISQKEV